MRNVLFMLPVLVSTSAWAIDLEGTYGTKESCAWLRKVEANPNASFPPNVDTFSYLDERGVRGWEWDCEFLDSKTSSNGSQLVTAACASEGMEWPEVMLITTNGNGYDVINKIANGEPNTTSFPVRCK